MSEERQKQQARIESGRVYLSNVSQEERKQAPTRRELAISRVRAFNVSRDEARAERERRRREKRERQKQFDFEEAKRVQAQRQRLAERHEARGALQEERRILKEERRRYPSRGRRLARRGVSFERSLGYRLRGSKRKSSKSSLRKKLPYHHGQHKNDIQCNIYRKKLRQQRNRAKLRRELNR